MRIYIIVAEPCIDAKVVNSFMEAARSTDLATRGYVCSQPA